MLSSPHILYACVTMNLTCIRKSTGSCFRSFLLCALFMGTAIPGVQAEYQWFEFLKTRKGRQKARLAAISLFTLIFCGLLLYRNSGKNGASVQQKKGKKKKTKSPIQKQIKSEPQPQDIETYKDQSKEHLTLLEHILVTTCLDTFSIPHTIVARQDDRQSVIDILFAPVDMQKMGCLPTFLTSITPHASPLSYIKNHSTDGNKRILLEQLILLHKNYKRENELLINQKIDRVLHVGLHNSPQNVQLHNYQEGQYDEYVIVHKLQTPPDVDQESIPYLQQQSLLNLLHAIFYEWSLGTEARYKFSLYPKDEMKKLNNQKIMDISTTYVRGSLTTAPEKNELFLCKIDQPKKMTNLLQTIQDICSKNTIKDTENVIVIENRKLREKFLKYCILHSDKEEIDFTSGTIEVKKSDKDKDWWHYPIDPRITKETAEKIFVSYGLPAANT